MLLWLLDPGLLVVEPGQCSEYQRCAGAGLLPPHISSLTPRYSCWSMCIVSCELHLDILYVEFLICDIQNKIRSPFSIWTNIILNLLNIAGVMNLAWSLSTYLHRKMMSMMVTSGAFAWTELSRHLVCGGLPPPRSWSRGPPIRFCSQITRHEIIIF